MLFTLSFPFSWLDTEDDEVPGDCGDTRRKKPGSLH